MDPDSTLVLFRTLPAKLRLSPEEKRRLRQFACELSERVVAARAFACLITTDAELRRLNRDFLKHDYATDVLSFPLGADNNLGEVAISIERAEAQALEFGHTRVDEIRVLMLHGLLHLSGFDHEIDRGQMRRAEQKWRSEFELPATLISRASPVRAAQ